MIPHSDSFAPDEDELDSALLERYWLGEASPEETAALDAWFAEHPTWERRYDRLRRGIATETLAGLPPDRISHLIAGTLEAINERRNEGATQSSAPAVAVPRGQPRVVGATSLWSRVGGVSRVGIGLALLLTIGLVWQLPRHMAPPARDNVVQPLSHPSVYTTADGQRATIKLPDESVVILNVGSRLEVPADFAMGNRTVQLRGEALFTVSHHQGNPFTVMAGPSVTRVLGTQFLVKAYDNDTPAVVAVRDGKVSVGSRVLTAMQQIAVSESGVSEIQRADATQFSFEKGVLHIANMPLRDAVPLLNRWYDIDIRFGDPSLGNRRIAAELTAGAFSDLIEVFEYSFNMRVVRSGRVLTLYPKA